MSAFRKLMMGSAISAFGSGLFRACAMVFFINTIHLPVKGIGAALSVGALLGILLASPVGRLTDRKGSIPLLIAVLLIRAVAYSCLALVNTMLTYAICVIVALAGDYLTPSLNQSLIGTLLSSEERTRALAILKAIKNSAVTVGLLIGSVALKFGTNEMIRGTMLMNGLSFLVLAWVIFTLPNIKNKKSQTFTAEASLNTRTPILKSPYENFWFLILTGANGILLLYDTTLVVLLPMWIVYCTNLEPSLVPLFFAINTVFTVGLQLWLPKTEVGNSWKLGVIFGVIAFLIASLSFSFAGQHDLLHAVGWALIAVISLTLAESLCGIASWNLSYAIVGREHFIQRSSEYLSVFNMSYAINALLGPILMSGVILPIMPYGWLVLGTLFLGAGILVMTASKHLAINAR